MVGRNVPIVLFRRVTSLPRTCTFRTYHRYRMLSADGQPPLPWTDERLVAISAVRRACLVTRRVFETMVNPEFMTKNDQSPVTGV